MITPRWGRGWVFGLLPAREVGLMVTSHWESWFQGYSPLGERVGRMITPCWGEGGSFWLLSTGEVGLMVTSDWGSWFQGYSPLGGEGRVLRSLLTGDGGFHGYFLKKRDKR